MAEASPATLSVCVVYSPQARVVLEQPLVLAPGSTVLDALRLSGLLEVPGIELDRVGVWGRKASPTQELKDADRVEIYRTLQVDPKVARRERYASQGPGSAGLFAKRRSNAKAGY